MKRKLLICLFICFSLIIFIPSVKSSDLTKEEYDSINNNLKEEIETLENEIASLNLEIELKEEQYANLSNELESLITKEAYYDWINKCNIYCVRANMKVSVEHYNTNFLGIKTKSESFVANGFIFDSLDDTKYVLTTYDVLKDRGYSKIKCTLSDAFQTNYQASICYKSENYGLAVLKFTDTYKKDLYKITFANDNPKVSDLVCNIDSNNMYNHMNFSKIISYKENDNFDFNVYENDVDGSYDNSGAMSLDINGNVIGIVTSYLSDDGICQTIPVLKIREYLVANGFSLE